MSRGCRLLTPEQEQQLLVAALHREQLTYKALARRLGLTPTQVRDVLYRLRRENRLNYERIRAPAPA